MIKATSRVSCGIQGCTHYLVLHIPIRQGRPAKRHQKAPMLPNYELTVTPVIDALGNVVSATEHRAISKALAKILKE